LLISESGVVRGDTVAGRAESAQQVFDRLAAVGIDFDDVLDVLEREGVEKFSTSWHELVATVQDQMERSRG
jgi:transaldolase